MADTYELTPEKQYRHSVTTSFSPDADDTRIVADMKAMFRTARATRAPMVRLWNKAHRALRSRPKGYDTGADWKPNLRVPEIFPIVRSSVGFKLDQRIVTEISPVTELGSEYHAWTQQRCSDLETVMEVTGKVNDEEIEYQKMCWDADTYGTGILKTTWDATLAGGLGDAVIRRINPYTFYPDPAATCMDDADYFIEVRPMSVQQLDRRFPGKGKLFVRGGAQEATDEQPSQLHAPVSKIPRAMSDAISPATSPRWNLPKDEHSVHRDTITVLECWIREHEVFEPKDEFGYASVEDGWRVVVVAGDHVLLNEKASDLWEHGKHPYDRYVLHDIGEFWGISTVELLGPLQSGYNRLLQAIQQNIELTGNPILMEEYGSQTSRQQIAANKPGTRMNKRKGTETKWMEPPRLSAESMSLMQFLLSRMEAISGIQAMTRGGSPQGRAAEGVHGALQEAGFVGIREQLRNMEATLRGAYMKKAQLIAENYTEPRFLASTGPDGQPTSMLLSSRHFMAPTEDGAVPMEYMINLDAGSKSHTSRRVRQDTATTLFTLGAMDVLSLLEAHEWPRPEKVLKRIGDQQASILATGAPGKRERERR